MITDRAPDLTLARTNEEKFQLLLDAYTRLRREIDSGLQSIDERNMTLRYKKRVEDTEGNVSQIIHDAQQLATQVIDAKGNIASLTVKANEIKLEVSDKVSKSTFTQTADRLDLKIENTDKDIRSDIEVTAGELRSTIADTDEGLKSLINQTAEAFTLLIDDPENGLRALIHATKKDLTSTIEEKTADKISSTTATQTSTSFSLMVSNGVGNTGMVLDKNGLLVENGYIMIRSENGVVFSADTSGNLSLRGNIQAGSKIFGTEIQASKMIGGMVASNEPGLNRIEMQGTTLTTYMGNVRHGPEFSAQAYGKLAALNFYNSGTEVFALNYQYEGGRFAGDKVFLDAKVPMKLQSSSNMSLQAGGQIYIMSSVWMDQSDILRNDGRLKYTQNTYEFGNITFNYDGVNVHVFVNGGKVGTVPR